MSFYSSYDEEKRQASIFFSVIKRLRKDVFSVSAANIEKTLVFGGFDYQKLILM
jgi:hypothetical protein